MAITVTLTSNAIKPFEFSDIDEGSLWRDFDGDLFLAVTRDFDKRQLVGLILKPDMHYSHIIMNWQELTKFIGSVTISSD